MPPFQQHLSCLAQLLASRTWAGLRCGVQSVAGRGSSLPTCLGAGKSAESLQILDTSGHDLSPFRVRAVSRGNVQRPSAKPRQVGLVSRRAQGSSAVVQQMGGLGRQLPSHPTPPCSPSSRCTWLRLACPSGHFLRRVRTSSALRTLLHPHPLSACGIAPNLFFTFNNSMLHA